MTQQVEDAETIGPDAQLQLIEDRAGDREVRFRSSASRAAVVYTRDEIFALIATLASYARQLD